MAKKLTEDQINWILSVDASEAQQEIRKLVKTNRELVNVNKERRQELIKLEAQGKKETEEYKNLEAEVKKASDAISTNNKIIGELEKKLDITGLTMVQLKKKARDLQRQLDQTVQSTHQEEYQALQYELDRVRGRMDELRAAGRHVQNEMSYTEKAISKVTVAMKLFVAVQLWQYLKNIGTQAYNTRKEFATYEAVLKNATGSTKAAASAMKMIQTLAADTPASVAEWTQAYIKLINRGITPTKDELIQMGDIASSQGKDIDQFIEALLDAMTGENERLKEFGITAEKNGETTAFTFRGVTTEVQNTDQAIKNYILSLGKLQGVQGSMAIQMEELAGLESNLGDQMDAIYNKIGKKLEPAIKSFMGFLGNSMGKLSSMLDTSTESFEKQYDKVFVLEEKVPQLTQRYNELTSKTGLSKDEQAELNTLMKELSRIMPGAISGWDEYGNILSINTDKIDEYVASQKRLLAAMNEEEINETKKKMKEAQEDIASYQKLIKEGGKWKTDRGTGDMFFVEWTPKQIADFEKNIKEASEIYANQQAYLDELTGKSIEKRMEERKMEAQVTRELNAMNKETLEAWIADERNAASEYMEIAKQIYKSRFPEQTETGTDNKDKDDPVKAALEQQKLLYQQQQIELKQRYLSGTDEQLQTQTQFNKAMEDLLLQDLNARLAIYGLEKEQRQQLEQQILDIRIKAMEDFYAKKAELESQQTSFRRQSDEEAMAENEEWMNTEMNKLQQKNKERNEIIRQSLEAQAESYKEYGAQIGNAIGTLFSDQEDKAEHFADAMIDVMFDILQSFIQTQITQLIATGISGTGKATVEAMSTPQSALTFGAAGSAITAALTAVIGSAVAYGKSKLKALLHKDKSDETTGLNSYTRIPGKQSGGYIDVTRAQDGRRYHAKYNPSMRGFVSRPTVIVGEGPAGMSREWVASNDAVNNPTVAPILSILDAAQQAGTIRTLDLNKYIQSRTIAGKAEGGTIPGAVSIAPSPSPGFTELEEKMLKVLESLDKNGIHAYTLLDEFEKCQNLRNKSRKIGSK